jgi:adenosine deaminase
LHLEGTLEPELLFRLSSENGMTLPAKEDEAFASIDNLLARYRRFTSLDGKESIL